MKTRDEFLSMRFRDLKRYLLLLGVSEKEISKRLDKQELVDLALLYSKNKLKTSTKRILKETKQTFINTIISNILPESFLPYISIITTSISILLILLFIYYFYNAFEELFQSFFQWLLTWFQYPLMKLPVLKYAYKKKLFIPGILLILSILLDLYIVHIQVSVIIRWFISSNSIFLAQTLSFPLQMPMSDSIGFMSGIDIGPMITTWLLKKVKEWFESKSAELIMKYKNE